MKRVSPARAASAAATLVGRKSRNRATGQKKEVKKVEYKMLDVQHSVYAGTGDQ